MDLIKQTTSIAFQTDTDVTKTILMKTKLSAYLIDIKIQHTHLESDAPRRQRSRGRRSANDPEHEPPAPAHPAAERLQRPEPAGGGEGVAGEEVRAAEQAEDERHDGVGDLLGAAGIDVDEPEAELGGEGRVHGAVGGAEAEDELPGLEAALGGAGEEGKGMEEDSGGGLDPAVGDAGERDVLDGRDAGEGVLLEGGVLEAVEGNDEWDRPGRTSRLGRPGVVVVTAHRPLVTRSVVPRIHLLYELCCSSRFLFLRGRLGDQNPIFGSWV